MSAADIAVLLQPGKAIEVPQGTTRIIVTNPSDEEGALQISASTIIWTQKIPSAPQGRDLPVSVDGQAKITNVGPVALSIVY
jgi:hypothetical protein